MSHGGASQALELGQGRRLRSRTRRPRPRKLGASQQAFSPTAVCRLFGNAGQI